MFAYEFGFSLFISISLVENIKIGYYLQDHIKLKFLVLYALGTIIGTIIFVFIPVSTVIHAVVCVNFAPFVF